MSLPVSVIDIRTLGSGQTLACESCGEIADPRRLYSFLEEHTAHKSLVMMREDDHGDFYVSGELAPLES